jgi:hypothetical protein
MVNRERRRVLLRHDISAVDSDRMCVTPTSSRVFNSEQCLINCQKLHWSVESRSTRRTHYLRRGKLLTESLACATIQAAIENMILYFSRSTLNVLIYA